MGLWSRLLHALRAGYVKDKGINMAISLPLVTRAEYKSYMGISSNTSDSAIDNLIPKVSDLVKTICRRSFIDYVGNPKIEYSEGGTDAIQLDEYPVQSILSLEYSEDYGNNYTTLVQYEDFVLSKATNSLRPVLKSIFPEAINGYRITYTAGYDDIPNDLKLVTLDIIAYYLKNDSAVHTHKNVNPNSMQIEYLSNTHFPAHIKRVLDLYTASYN